jgi:hypothetical protein
MDRVVVEIDMRYPVSATGNKTDFERDWKIDQVFGNPTTYGFHEGIDINLKTGGDTDLGQEIKAIAKGTIVYYHFASHPTYGFGRHLVYRIDGSWGVRWVHCAHMQDTSFLGAVQDVTEGQIIGHLGKSGTPYAHLHFAIWKVDPATVPANTSSGKSIDNIAKTTTELNQYWEDPITFIETWMAAPAPTPSPINDQTTYDFGSPWGVMEMQAVRSTMNDQKAQIESKNTEISQLQTKIQNAKNALG